MKEEMSEAQKVFEVKKSFNNAKRLSGHMAELLYHQDETVKEKIIASGLLFASIAALHGVTLHQATALLMEVYRMAEKYGEERGSMQ